MGKVDENKRYKLNNMLDAALQLFTDKGLANTSISDIVERSGVAKGTFYLYFKDKYDIRNKLVVHESRKLLRNAYEAMQLDMPDAMEDRLLFMVGHMLDALAARHELLRLISKNLSWGVVRREITRSEWDDDFEFLRGFHAMTEAFGIAQRDSEIMLYLITELVGAACYNTILYEEPCDLETLKPHLFESVRRIIRQFTEPVKKLEADT